MSVKFEVKMTDKIMYDFLLYHTYTHMSGLLGAMIGVLALGMGINYMLSGDSMAAMPAFILAALEDFSKAVSTNRAVILYVTRMRALIFPRESMEEQYEAAVKMISTHMPPKNVKIRHIAG